MATKPFPTAITWTTWSTGIYTIHMATIVMITARWTWWPLEIAEQKTNPVLNRIHETASPSCGLLGNRPPKRLAHFEIGLHTFIGVVQQTLIDGPFSRLSEHNDRRSAKEKHALFIPAVK